MNGRILSEFQRAFRNGHVEEHASGLFFPKQKAILGGLFAFNHCKGEWEDGGWDESPNLIVSQGRVYEQGATLLGVAGQSNWYIAPFATNTTPADSLTAATFSSVQTEFTNYIETTRQPWVRNAAGSVAGTVSNSDAPAVITIDTGGQTAVYGGALISVSGKGGTSGILYACALATKSKTGLDAGDTLGFKYTIALTSS